MISSLTSSKIQGVRPWDSPEQPAFANSQAAWLVRAMLASLCENREVKSSRRGATEIPVTTKVSQVTHGLSHLK